MSFCTYSAEFTAGMFTSVENRFITNYLPEADGDAVRAYLYGLYLCQCAKEFDGEQAAKLLKIPFSRFVEIFRFWEECDLVHVLSVSPLFVEYLPVNAAIGKPKPLRPEKYAEFNRAFYMLLQRAGKEFRPYEMQRILEFLERQPMEPQAFLLVAEYCLKKDGAKLSANHILRKAEQLCNDGKFTYEQVEAYFSDFNEHEAELSKIFTLLNLSRKPQESDNALLEKWLSQGMDMGSVLCAAESMRRGSMQSLDALISELKERGLTEKKAVKEYLSEREKAVSLIYAVARKLGVKVENPRPFSEEYAEKWLERGYGQESLLRLAGICMKLSFGFGEMDALLDSLYREGIKDAGLLSYCEEREKELKLLQKIQSKCGVVKKTQSALDTMASWKRSGYSDEMILEAAQRSAGASSPIAYMNKLLTEWKKEGASTPSEIKSAPPSYRDETAVAVDLRAERERYYAILQQNAISLSEKAKKRAARDAAFTEADKAVRQGEIALARAEVYAPETVPAAREELLLRQNARREALARLGLSDEDFVPKYRCEKCRDTGFLPDGRMCDCYPK